MLLPEEEKASEGDVLAGILQQVEEANDAFNRQSGKPYYVEMSIGGVPVVCGGSLELEKVLSGADEKLYEAKRRRRPSSIK